METCDRLDVRHLRGLLAEHRVTRKQLAQASGLNPHYVSRVLCGRSPGELAMMKLARGLRRLGLECELPHAS